MWRVWFKQLAQYGILGIINNIGGYILYLLLTSFGLTPKLTMTMLYGLGVFVGFFCAKRFIFSCVGSITYIGIRYVVAHFFGYILNFLILFLFVDVMKYPHQLVQAFSIITVAGFLFLTFKFYVFR